MSQSDLNKLAEKTKNELDTLSELAESLETKLQMYMERYSKFIETLSNMMKKMSDTSSSIISNLK